MAHGGELSKRFLSLVTEELGASLIRPISSAAREGSGSVPFLKRVLGRPWTPARKAQPYWHGEPAVTERGHRHWTC